MLYIRLKLTLYQHQQHIPKVPVHLKNAFYFAYSVKPREPPSLRALVYAGCSGRRKTRDNEANHKPVLSDEPGYVRMRDSVRFQ